MKTQTPFYQLILRAVLRKVSPMVIRVLVVPDYLELSSFDEVFRTLLGWEGLGLSFHIHGQEFTSFLRRARVHRTALRDFQLRPRETFSLRLRRIGSLGIGASRSRLRSLKQRR
jgi:hypothetical protein